MVLNGTRLRLVSGTADLDCKQVGRAWCWEGWMAIRSPHIGNVLKVASTESSMNLTWSSQRKGLGKPHTVALNSWEEPCFSRWALPDNIPCGRKKKEKNGKVGVGPFLSKYKCGPEFRAQTGLAGRSGHAKPMTPHRWDAGLSCLPILQQLCDS